MILIKISELLFGSYEHAFELAWHYESSERVDVIFVGDCMHGQLVLSIFQTLQDELENQKLKVPLFLGCHQIFAPPLPPFQLSQFSFVEVC